MRDGWPTRSCPDLALEAMAYRGSRGEGMDTVLLVLSLTRYSYSNSTLTGRQKGFGTDVNEPCYPDINRAPALRLACALLHVKSI